MILVADASALIALASCDHLHLLAQLFGHVCVPEAVFDEVTMSNKPQAKKLAVYLADKVSKIDMSNFVFLDGYADLGETQAMLLYKQISADCLLIDDKRGRKVAKMNHIKTIGSLGVLLQAKHAGLIECIAPLIREITAGPIFMSQSLIDTVLDLAGESKS